MRTSRASHRRGPEKGAGAFRRHRRRLRARLRPAGSAAEAARRTLDAIKSAAALKKQRLLLQRSATEFTLARVDAQITAKGEKDPAGGLDSLMDADDLNKSTVPAYRQHYEAIHGQAQAKMTGVLETFRPTVTGARRNKALLENMVRALFGEKVDDAAARELAQAWSEASEWLRLRSTPPAARSARSRIGACRKATTA
ncbi:MAG: hypothetical protein WDM81_13585 [Rhizomicrobium sp.]